MNQPRSSIAKVIATLSAAVLAAGVLVACGSDSDTNKADTPTSSSTPTETEEPESTSESEAPAPTESEDPEPEDSEGADEAPSANLVPENLKEAGSWTVAFMPDYPPQSFMDGDDFIGVNIDVMQALSRMMGLDLNIEQVKYDAMLAGLDAERYDLAGVGFYPSEPREEGHNLVGYLMARQSIIVSDQYDGPPLSSYESLCGLNVALVAGTPHEARLEEACDGKDPANIQIFPGDTAMFAAITSGRADATITSTATSDHMTEATDGAMVRGGEPFTCTIAGFAMRKSDEELFDAVADAMDRIQQSGEYQQILDDWHLGDLALDRLWKSPMTGNFSADDCSAL